MFNILRKIFGTKNEREINRIKSLIVRVNELESEFEKLSNEELRQKTVLFRERLNQGAPLDSLLPEAFANVREASKRTIKQRHFDVQLVGGVVLHEGKISEMKTGEGKTLTATAPIYLNALTGRGVHLVTVNDFLARRDAEWMGAIYSFLGLSTGLIVHGLSDSQRRQSYACDVTYGTNNEFGFDYLRDNMKSELSRFVQRGHYFGIVDEVDSILVDEARTPLIISGPVDTATELFNKVNTAIPGLQKDSDYVVDEKARTVALTEDGISKLEKRLRVDNLYDPKNIEFLHHVQQALKAHIIFKKDVDYVVREGKVIIVDEFTGRLMPGRRYSDGLHGALEAKEHVQVEQETQTVATITFQNYFRLYEKLAGMTGTADTEAVEFKKIYNLDVVVIPTNRVMIRADHSDVVFRTAKEKFNVIADEIEAAQKRGQPVLVGTVSVEKSELLSRLLTKRRVPHEVLNAKNHAREADIIKSAGQRGHITISTNMAGRGTDIILGEGIPALGGLYVFGTERHESRRIDNQLRGRSGRQGDQGASKFFLSLEDDLLRIFASDRLSNIMARLGMQEGEAIVSPMVTRAIERAQKRVEEHNFSIRKHLLEYDDVMNQQRQVIYGKRRAILEGRGSLDFFSNVIGQYADNVVDKYSPESTNTDRWHLDKIANDAQAEFGMPVRLSSIDQTKTMVSEIVDAIISQVTEAYNEKCRLIGEDYMKKIESYIHLQVIDTAWKDHLLGMDTLKDSVSLRGYGQRDPLQEYKKEAFRLFASMMARIEDDTVLALVRMPPPKITVEEPKPVEENKDQLVYHHPNTATAGPPISGDSLKPKQLDEDKLIYHGSRSAPAEKQPNPQPFKRNQEKVGRNDPCPCGSGKKFKKCHGATGLQAET